MEVAGYVNVEVRADVAGLDKGLEQAKQKAVAFDKGVSGNMANVATSSNKMAQDVARGATQIAAANDNIVNKVVRTGGAIKAFATSIKGAFVSLAAAFAFDMIAKASDAYTGLQSNLKLAGLAGTELKGVQDQLFAVAMSNGVAVGSLGQLYGRLSAAGKDLGATQESLMNVTRGVAAAIKVQGGDASQASGALMQLGQALGGGVVRAEEFNSILEGARPIAQAAAEGMFGVGASVTQLRNAVIAGTVSSKEFYAALEKGLVEVEKKAAGMPMTIGGAFQALTNGFINLVGAFNSATGTMTLITNIIYGIGRGMYYAGEAINFIAPVFQVLGNIAGMVWMGLQKVGSMFSWLTPVMQVAGVTLATYWGATAIMAISRSLGALVISLFTTGGAFSAMSRMAMIAMTGLTRAIGFATMAVRMLTMAMLLNPYAAAAAAIALVVVALYKWGQAFEPVKKYFEWLWDTGLKIIEALKKAWEDFTKTGIGAWVQKGIDMVFKVDGDEAATKMNDAVKKGGKDAAKDIGDSGKKVGQLAAAELEPTIGAISAAMKPDQDAYHMPADILGKGVQTGAKEGAAAMQGGVKQGASEGGMIFEAAGIKFGKTAADMMTRAGMDVAYIMKRAIGAAMQQAKADITNTFWDSQLKIAEANKLNAEAFAIRTGQTGGGGSSGSGVKSGGTVRSMDISSMLPNYKRQEYNYAGEGGSKVGGNGGGSGGSGGVQIVNVLDPKAAVSAMDTRTGQLSILNTIKDNRSEIQAMLGVA